MRNSKGIKIGLNRNRSTKRQKLSVKRKTKIISVKTNANIEPTNKVSISCSYFHMMHIL